MSSQLNSKYLLHNKLLITYKMIFPTKEPNSVDATTTGGYEINDVSGRSKLTYENGLLTAFNEDKVIFLCHTSSFSRFDNIWKIEQQ